MLLLAHFDQFPGTASPGSALEEALNGAGKLLHRRSLVFVISDFRVAGWEIPFARLAEKHDVIAVCISDVQDESLPEAGSIPFTDSESGASVVLPTSSGRFRTAWREDGRRRMEKWKTACSAHSGFPLVLSTSDDPALVLTRFFSHREHLQ